MQPLTPYATQALAAFQRLLPDLAALAEVLDGEFRINTRSPSGWLLWVWSEGEGLIVGFAEWHGHFDYPEGEPAQAAANAAALVQEFRSGELELAAWYRGEQYAGSATHDVGTAIESPSWLPAGGAELRLRRWA